MSFEKLVQKSLENPEEYWSEIATALKWDQKWDRVMDNSKSPFTKWFVGGRLNMCYNCVDKHVENGFGDNIAFVYDSPMNNIIKRFTYTEVLEIVSKLAGVLVNFGAQKGDIVAVYMPSIPEGAFAFLACARIGAIHNSIPGGLPAEDLKLRLDHSQPKVLLTTSHGFYPRGWVEFQLEIKKALSICEHKLTKILWYQREGMTKVNITEGLDVIWQDALKEATPHPCVSMEATSPLFIIYTSGSTGTPKAVVHTIGSYAVRLAHDARTTYSKDKQNSILYGTTSYGWLAGHSLVVYGPLLQCGRSIVYEGDSLLMTDARELYRLISEHKITAIMIRPGVQRATKGMDPDALISKDYDLSSLKIIITGGEPIDIPTLEWVYKSFQVPILNCWGQTELAGMLTGQPDFSIFNDQNFYSLSGKICPGWRIECLKEDMTPTKTREIGRLLIKLPLAPGAFDTLYKNDALCKTIYYDQYPGYFDTKDEGYITENGEVKMERRADDVIKAGPIYVSANDIEQVILEHPSVSEATVVAQPHNAHREIPIAFVILSKGSKINKEHFRQEIVDKVRAYFGKSMPFDSVVLVSDLPRSMTGKTHKASLAAMLKRIEPATGGVENPEVLPAILQALKLVSVL